MRLTTHQRNQIQRLIQAHLGEGTLVSVFGSRTDDEKRGGDVDLFIEPLRRVSLMQRAALQLDLENALSLPVDLLISEPSKPLSAFQMIAKARCQPLGGHP